MPKVIQKEDTHACERPEPWSKKGRPMNKYRANGFSLISFKLGELKILEDGNFWKGYTVLL